MGICWGFLCVAWGSNSMSRWSLIKLLVFELFFGEMWWYSLPVSLFELILGSGRFYAAQSWWAGEASSNLEFQSYCLMSCYNIGVPCKFVCLFVCLFGRILGSVRSYIVLYRAQTQWVGETWSNLNFMSNVLVSCCDIGDPPPELKC